MGITRSDAPKARLLDLTRLVRRAGRPLTGVDRVEKAYLDRFLEKDAPLFGLVRSSFGFFLLDAEGCGLLANALKRGDFGAPDRLSRLKRGIDPQRAGLESLLRSACLARCLPIGLKAMLRSHLPQPLTYFNVGHSNLTERVFKAVKSLPESRIAVMIHDTIPLDFPQYQRAETGMAFAGILHRAATHADVILCNSQQTEADVLRHTAPKTPRCLVAPLGVPRPQPGEAPQGPWSGQPFFVTIGTIEPRKNHAFLLGLWERVPEAHLLICGSRGWENDAVFATLDTQPPRVHELANLTDGQLFALLKQSKGLLFPSHAEGYGLPPIEAAALNVPILCNDLPIYREVLGDIPVYAGVADSYPWIKGIGDMMSGTIGTTQERAQGWQPPGWDAHFNNVLTSIW